MGSKRPLVSRKIVEFWNHSHILISVKTPLNSWECSLNILILFNKNEYQSVDILSIALRTS